MLSNKTKYALKALTILAEEYPLKQPCLISSLSQKARVPKKFLELILLELKNRGVLLSKKGKGGGYLLSKPPHQIKLGTVMRILEGPLAPLQCLSQTAYRRCDECVDEATCNVRLMMKEFYDAQTEFLDSRTLEDMFAKTASTANYSI